VTPIAVYVHIPFCPTKCGYCDFNSYAMQGDIVGRTVAAIAAEIERSPLAGRPAKTIFFGGGTPTFLEPDDLNRLLKTVLEAHPPLPGCEITSEANPGTVDAGKFKSMRDAGFNRVSLGAQSFLDTDLVRLGRVHRSGEIERAVQAARGAGFENLNLDLMFALPNQGTRAWEANLDRALELQPEHLSLYCLTIEPNTAFYKQQLRGSLDLPEEDLQTVMYDHCCARTEAAGYEQYEISNFAQPGRECKHNLEYWNGDEYAGYGPGAVGSYGVDGDRIRATNLKHPERYCDAVERDQPLTFDAETLSPDSRRTESIMLGLRLNRGLDASEVDLPARGLKKVVDAQWAEFDQGRLRLTPAGRHFCSEVVLALL
jgi:oxygen-independent coproporphyrinogen-3 oxidase